MNTTTERMLSEERGDSITFFRRILVLAGPSPEGEVTETKFQNRRCEIEVEVYYPHHQLNPIAWIVHLITFLRFSSIYDGIRRGKYKNAFAHESGLRWKIRSAPAHSFTRTFVISMAFTVRGAFLLPSKNQPYETAIITRAGEQHRRENHWPLHDFSAPKA